MNSQTDDTLVKKKIKMVQANEVLLLARSSSYGFTGALVLGNEVLLGDMDVIDL